MFSGYTFVSWGDSAPTHADKAAVVDIKVVPELETNQTTRCKDFSPKCLQAVSEMATRQTAIVQYVNVSSCENINFLKLDSNCFTGFNFIILLHN